MDSLDMFARPAPFSSPIHGTRAMFSEQTMMPRDEADLDAYAPWYGNQITAGEAVAMPLAFWTLFSPGRCNEGVYLFAHHGFHHRPHGTLSQAAEGGVKFPLVRQQWGDGSTVDV
jgi:hypothetical protein